MIFVVVFVVVVVVVVVVFVVVVIVAVDVVIVGIVVGVGVYVHILVLVLVRGRDLVMVLLLLFVFLFLFVFSLLFFFAVLRVVAQVFRDSHEIVFYAEVHAVVGNTSAPHTTIFSSQSKTKLSYLLYTLSRYVRSGRRTHHRRRLTCVWTLLFLSSVGAEKRGRGRWANGRGRKWGFSRCSRGITLRGTTSQTSRKVSVCVLS